MQILVDVRTKEEFDEKHAKDAVNIPLGEILAGNLGALKDVKKDATIGVYCLSGARSEAAKRKLISLGFGNVSNLGGLSDVE